MQSTNTRLRQIVIDDTFPKLIWEVDRMHTLIASLIPYSDIAAFAAPLEASLEAVDLAPLLAALEAVETQFQSIPPSRILTSFANAVAYVHIHEPTASLVGPNVW